MAAYILLGGGMGITAAPATGKIMSAVPPAKAGVGSAVNDTTPELGGALGIAVLGSIANAAYTCGLDLDGLDLPADVESTATESIGTVMMIAERLGPAGSQLVTRADAAFSDAFNLAAWTTAGLAAAAAVPVWTRFRPEHELAAETGQDEPVIAGANT